MLPVPSMVHRQTPAPPDTVLGHPERYVGAHSARLAEWPHACCPPRRARMVGRGLGLSGTSNGLVLCPAVGGPRRFPGVRSRIPSISWAGGTVRSAAPPVRSGTAV